MVNRIQYRKFITHSGTKVLAGKDAKQNEILVKEYIGKNNIIMHTAKPGSPFCIITEKLRKGDKKETAKFCAKRSKDWRDNKDDVIVHIFTGKDIRKKKDMKIGTFGIKKFKVIKIKKSEIEDFEF